MPIDLNNYKIIRECKGSPANKIFIVEDKETHHMMVMKLIKVQDLTKQLREIEVHKKLNYKFVIKLIDSDVQKNCIALLIEYAKYGDLFSMLHKLHEIPERRVLKFFYQFVKAIDYLHGNGFLHRDIKPENILITKKFSPRLADFGTSAQVEMVKNTFCGTYEYMAPEIYLREKQTNKADIWALGVLLYEMTHQVTPFKNQSVNGVKRMLQNDKIRFKAELNPLIKRLILRILRFAPDERPSTAEILTDELFAEFRKPAPLQAIDAKLAGKSLQTSKIHIVTQSKRPAPRVISKAIAILHFRKQEPFPRTKSSYYDDKTIKKTCQFEDDQLTTQNSSFKQTHKIFDSLPRMNSKQDLFVSNDKLNDSPPLQDLYSSTKYIKAEVPEIILPAKKYSKNEISSKDLSPLTYTAPSPNNVDPNCHSLGASGSKSNKSTHFKFEPVHTKNVAFNPKGDYMNMEFKLNSSTNLLQNLLAKNPKNNNYKSEKSMNPEQSPNFYEKTLANRENSQSRKLVQAPLNFSSDLFSQKAASYRAAEYVSQAKKPPKPVELATGKPHALHSSRDMH